MPRRTPHDDESAPTGPTIDDGASDDGVSSEGVISEGAEPEWRRRRRLAAVFGDVLPDTTSDERDPETADADASAEDAGDRWLRSQVPPHHG